METQNSQNKVGVFFQNFEIFKIMLSGEQLSHASN
jgi:ABC-type polar amino acid transport system ATPase subunit